MAERIFRYDDQWAAVDHLCGYAVMAVRFEGDGAAVTLAFCSPVDQREGRWSRKAGYDHCAARYWTTSTIADAAEAPRTSLRLPFRPDWAVRDYVVEAALRGHTYIPHVIVKRIRKGARNALVLA
jgi:hypothetical protein